MIRLHATAVADPDGWAALLSGPPGAGKSDLALRMIDRGWRLVADDGVELTAVGGRLIARAPATIAGLIECRGLGILRLPALQAAPVALLVRLGSEPERLPEPATDCLEGIAIRALALDPWTISASIRLGHAFTLARGALERGAAP